MFAVAAVGLYSKAFLAAACRSVSVKGLPILLAALDESRRTRAGIITVANHISVQDDPLAWGVMPVKSYFSPRTTRWTLGAADIMFTNPLFSAFFRSGQVIETFRGRGIWQPAVDAAIAKLDRGDWIHVFPEGKVNQLLSPHAQLLRFKWGIGRMIMDAQHTPLVVPIWLTGFDHIMPEDRGFPRFLPRLFKRLSVTVGDPHPLTDRLEPVLARWRADNPLRTPRPHDDPDQTAYRIQITRIVQEEVEKLGYSVLAPSRTT